MRNANIQRLVKACCDVASVAQIATSAITCARLGWRIEESEAWKPPVASSSKCSQTARSASRPRNPTIAELTSSSLNKISQSHDITLSMAMRLGSPALN